MGFFWRMELPSVGAEMTTLKLVKLKSWLKLMEVIFQTWMFPKIGVPHGTPKWMVYNGKHENPIKMDDLGVPLFLETPTCWRYYIRSISSRPHEPTDWPPKCRVEEGKSPAISG